MENNLRFLAICWAAQRAGLYFTCISSRLTAGEVEYIVKDSAAKVLFSTPGIGKVASEAAKLLSGVKCFSVGGAIEGFTLYEDAAAKMSVTRIADESAGSDMLYSFGYDRTAQRRASAAAGSAHRCAEPAAVSGAGSVRLQRRYDLPPHPCVIA
ncbi:MAG: AMP-binding protein [Rhizomicrobium sp.]